MTAPDVDICDVLERHVAENRLPSWVDSALTRAAAELRQTRKERDEAIRELGHLVDARVTIGELRSDLAAAVELLQYVANGGRPSAKARAFLDALAKRGGT